MADNDALFRGSIPEFYDRYLGAVLFKPYARDLAARVEVPVDGAILELACGTGILTRELRARLDPAVRIVATDLNQPMVAYAESQLETASGIEWRVADASALPFVSASFDAVVMQFGIMFVPDKAEAFREAMRVLVPGGRLYFNAWDGADRNPFARIAHETIAGCFPSDPPRFYEVPVSFHDSALIATMLAACGFVEVNIDEVALECVSDSAHDLATGLARGNPVSTAIVSRGGNLDEVILEIEKALTREGGSAPFRSTMRALVVSARRPGA